jgi:1,4-alpha-glucan branching enzyme
LPPKEDGSCRIPHLSEVKVIIRNKEGKLSERLSPWAVYVVQPTDLTYGINYKQKFWNPPESTKYKFQYRKPVKPDTLRIYECHVGIATEKLEVGSYRNFADNVIPRIKKQGYNTIQIMAIMEHAYYASFGYVVFFFELSSEFESSLLLLDLNLLFNFNKL